MLLRGFQMGSGIAQESNKDSGLPISVGMSVNKLVSKVATGEFKPNAEKHIPAGEEKDFWHLCRWENSYDWQTNGHL